MTGSTLAVILIPPAGTICPAAWLALVFYAGRHHPQRAGSNTAPGREGPGTAAQADQSQPGARPADPSAWQSQWPRPATPPAGHSRITHDDHRRHAVGVAT